MKKTFTRLPLRLIHSSIPKTRPATSVAFAEDFDSEVVLNTKTQDTDTANGQSTLQYALSLPKPINTWSMSQIEEIYRTPLMELLHSSQLQHRRFHDPTQVQLCTLMNIKSGGCTEDCKYCAQSSRYDTGVEAERMVKVDEVLEAAKEAKKNGSTRFCMGAAWRDMQGRKSGLKKIKEMVQIVNDMGMESCVTLGMVNDQQAKELKDAGLTAYNHNIDTSREHYPKVISTRTFDDRLQTIKNVQTAGLKACTGGILGLGETEKDHVSFLHTLATMNEHPESLPINRLVPIKGTPMYEEVKNKKLKMDEILRTIATARIVMPRAVIRLAAGRYTMKEMEQFMCFQAGANAIFTGKKMLTTMCNGWDEDKEMLQRWGLRPMESFKYKPNEEAVCEEHSHLVAASG